MSSPQPAPAPRRADAARNRARILDAARAAFADPRAEISMAEVARRAGVGMATLYRNFPGRQELLEALYTDEVDVICAAAETLAGEPAATALHAWLEHVYTFFRSKRQVGAELLRHSESGNPFFSQNRKRVLVVGRPLLIGAQRDGAVRPELTLEQILDMVSAIAKIEGDPAYVQPILQAALAGLRPLP